MKKYIITYWIRNVGENYSPFYEALKLCFPDHTHPQENMWIVRCEYNANQITNIIKPFLKENDTLFVSEITGDMAGWMPKTAWEWLKTDDQSNVSANTNTDAKEYILCAAIHYDNGIRYRFQTTTYGVDTGFVLCGYRHSNIIDVLPTNPHFLKRIYEDEEIDPAERQKYEELKYKYGWQEKDLLRCETTQGFLTSKGRFVNREEALAIARKAGQVKDDASYKSVLFSEDLY